MTVASAPAVAATIASPATQDLIVFNVNSLISLRFDASRNYGSKRYTMELNQVLIKIHGHYCKSGDTILTV